METRERANIARRDIFAALMTKGAPGVADVVYSLLSSVAQERFQESGVALPDFKEVVREAQEEIIDTIITRGVTCTYHTLGKWIDVVKTKSDPNKGDGG